MIPVQAHYLLTVILYQIVGVENACDSISIVLNGYISIVRVSIILVWLSIELVMIAPYHEVIGIIKLAIDFRIGQHCSLDFLGVHLLLF